MHTFSCLLSYESENAVIFIQSRFFSSSDAIKLTHLIAIHKTISFSNTFRESVLIHSLFHVCLIVDCSKCAHSTIIFFVSSVTDDSFPQIIQPSASTFSESAITISLALSLYSLSSSQIKFSQSLAYLIIIFQFILSASKQ
jgi:hypothetical protein